MKKYLITGGGFANKGAESMLYTLISELRAHGDCEITVQVVHGYEFANNCIPGIDFIPFSFKEREQILKPFVHLCNRVKLRLCKIFGLHCKNKLRLYRAIKMLILLLIFLDIRYHHSGIIRRLTTFRIQ